MSPRWMVKMEITDFSKGTAWSILPEAFDQVIRQYIGVVDDSTKPQTVALDRNAKGSDGEPYMIEDRVAIIPVTGPLSKRPSFFSYLFGGLSYQEIGEMVQRAAVDSKVSGILLNIDSPGGVVNGTEGLSDIIFGARGSKPVVAFADGAMTSAAYWLGSAAEVVMAGSTSVLGSIGVLMIHTDYSVMDQNVGVKTTYLTAGKYKALGNSAEPLTLEAKEYFQNQLNYLYSIFVDSVARNRDVETEKVLQDMAEGKLFIGQQAVAVGLADQIGTFEMAKDLVLSMINDKNYSFKAKDQNMDIKTKEQLAEAFPALVLEIQDGSKKAAEEQGKLAVTTERDRVVALVKIQFGAEQGESFGKLIHSDITPELFKATKDLVGVDVPKKDDQDDKTKADILAALKDSTPDNPGPDGKPDPSGKDYMVVCQEYKLEHKCSMLDAQRAVSKMNPDLRKKYIEKVNS